MILNTYAVLVVFIASLRLGISILVVGLGLRALWTGRPDLRPDSHEVAGNRFYLLFLLSLVLLGLNVASWPLLYLLLQSYVMEFPGVMCIYGVTQIGEGSLGPARHLPTLVTLLQIMKPALMFLGGAWFALYLLNRRTALGPLRPRLLALMLPLGMLAAADATAELAYVTLPKKEEMPSAGCCTAVRAENRFLPQGFTSEASRNEVTAAFYGGSAILMLGIAFQSRRTNPAARVPLVLLFAAASFVTAIASVFLIDVAAPRLLRLPFHHCAYDLLSRAPESVVSIALFLAGGFCVGWALFVRLLGASAETRPLLSAQARGLLRAGLWCYFVSICMMSMEWILT